MDGKLKKQQLKASEISLFCYQFSVVFKAGIPYLEGLQLLASDVFDGRMKQIVKEIGDDVEEGKLLYEAISARGVFPEYMTSMLKIAENTGRLGDVFEQLASYYEKNDILKQKIKNALTYPFVLIGLMTAVILLLILKVLPIFHEILLSVGGSIPSATQFVLSFSELLQSSMLIIIALLVLIIGYFLLIFKTNYFPRHRDSMLLSLPIVKTLYKKSVVVKFAGALAILTRSGMPIQSSLDLIIPLMDNKLIEEKLNQVVVKIEEGITMEKALRETGLFPELFLKMVALGNKTGELDNMLDKISEVYDRELSRSLHRMTVSIEPTLVIVLSLIVGAILLLVMLPLINIMSSIG
ncbi:type II secretion system F family protein [Fusibacter bizertensis]|uniref:Type II secretion system F family protein n=1 Tax=Fusibacter bizertensis TaxID=1488331 RepID=A0ABT6N9M3_9FIRM|nr:type II secretion system F family protein [Fusibacter bizertensis]MDH8677111.1 type II secretion system F family protein [Fusibacter bizertensis]